MHHFFEAITNTAGDSLIGYFGRVINRTTQNTVTLSSDENGTPIVVTSGVENMAKTDDYGNLSLYVDPGTYHLDIYAPNTTTFLYRVSDVAMNSTKGDPGPQGDEGPAGEGLAEVMAPGGAALVGATPDYPNAAAISQKDNNLGSIHVFQFIAPQYHQGILLRTLGNNLSAASDITSAIQQAINTASDLHRRLVGPAGLYPVRPNGSFAAEAGTVQRCFAMRNNMHLDFEEGASFRIPNGISTDAAPVFMAMFATNEQLSNISFRGLEMDMNGANNPISPNRNNTSLAHNGYSLWNQAMIHVTGTPGGNAALCNFVNIQKCRFINTPGVSCIVMAQSNGTNVALGKYWTVRDCYFGNLGYDSRDHSSIFAWAENVICEGNRFVNPTQLGSVSGGGVAAYEVHGANQVFRDNFVENFYQGMWIDTNQTRRTENILITGNTFNKMKAYGIQTYGLAPVTTHPRKVKIYSNFIYLDDNTHPNIALKGGIGVLSPYTMADFDIFDNHIEATGTTVGSSGFICSNVDVTGQAHTRIRFYRNYVIGTTIGATLQTNATAGLGDISVTDNVWRNLAPAGAFTTPQGVAYGGGTLQIDRLTILRNNCIDDRTTPLCAYGIRLEGKAGFLHVQDNIASGMTIGDYVEAGFTAVQRAGKYYQTFPYNPPSLANGANVAVYIPVPNLTFNDDVVAKMNVSTQGVTITSWVEVAAVGNTPGSVAVFFQNLTGGATPVDIASGSILLTINKG